MNVASVRSWLSWQMCHTVAADNISTPEVTLCKSQFYLWPSRDVVRTVAYFEWEVPDNSSIGLLTLIGMLAYSTFITLKELKTTCLDRNND